ncbi:hypothetical protein [Microscilla marina]|uniref:Lipoprotein, putative n=1 Tax=Microscilla marina ATCC 23134 TaxID=313606 RepID=A1ZC27_MICM2|nr:hypothetical protein [Microscilla marina]EAY31829.1 lipoprotein, putative [Microscilla marina ATCC 23134]
MASKQFFSRITSCVSILSIIFSCNTRQNQPRNTLVELKWQKNVLLLREFIKKIGISTENQEKINLAGYNRYGKLSIINNSNCRVLIRPFKHNYLNLLQTYYFSDGTGITNLEEPTSFFFAPNSLQVIHPSDSLQSFIMFKTHARKNESANTLTLVDSVSNTFRYFIKYTDIGSRKDSMFIVKLMLKRRGTAYQMSSKIYSRTVYPR